MLAALTLLLTLPALALAADFAVVRGGRLNLRQYPSSSSQSLGKYNSGSWVDVQGQSASGWYAVRTMDGKTGYMAGNYLTFAQSGSIGTVAYANGGYVNLRRGPSLDYAVVTRVTSGTTISILDASYEWNYVSATVNGATYTGYMHDSLIIKSTTTATVSTRNGGKVNVRRGPSSAYGSIGSLKSGTRVTVLLKGNGWYQITGGGLTGFMSAGYLSNMGTTGGGSGTVTTRTAYVNNPRSTQVLYLRETPSQRARALGQYKNGTQVKVVSYGATWCEVYVGTRHGYMMTRYLSFNNHYVTPTPEILYVTPAPTPQIVYVTRRARRARIRHDDHPCGGLRQRQQHDQRLLRSGDDLGEGDVHRRQAGDAAQIRYERLHDSGGWRCRVCLDVERELLKSGRRGDNRRISQPFPRILSPGGMI